LARPNGAKFHRARPNDVYEKSVAIVWATVCKTVRPMLLDRCLSCLSVTLVYCGQTVGWIKMKLGVQVGLGPDHIVLDEDPGSLPQRGTAPNFRPISVVPNGWID